MLYIIANALSGKGKGRQVAQAVADFLTEKKIAFRMRFTEKYRHAVDLARECSAEEDCTGLVAIGGDGTFNEVLCGMDTRVPLGVISSGSGNDFMRTIAPGSTLQQQMEAIARGNIREIDYLQVNDARSLNVTGTGFDVDILLREQKFRKVLSGSFCYYAALFVTLLSLKFRRFRLRIDDGEEFTESSVLMAMGNGRYFGGGMPVTPSAEPDDGKIDFLLIKQPPRIKIPRILIKFLKGRAAGETEYVSVMRCSKVEGSIEPPVALQLDGELRTINPFCVKIVPRGLKLFA